MANNIVQPDKYNNAEKTKTVVINGKAIFNKETVSDPHQINSVMTIFIKISITFRGQIMTQKIDKTYIYVILCISLLQ